MPSRSSATAFDRLVPDQRAALELVLRQGRSYGELAHLLGLPEETIRGRARNGVAGLAPDLPAPDRAGEIADWLLGQQPESHAARTRELLLADPHAQRWAAAVSIPLRDAPGGEAIPLLPVAPPAPMNGRTRAHEATASATALPPRDATLAHDAAEPGNAAATGSATTTGGTAAAGDATATGDVVVPDRGASRIGGAVLLGAAAVLVAAVLVFAFTRGDDDDGGALPVATTAATATPAGTAAISGNDIVLRGPAGSQAVGLMQLFRANDGTVRFALAATGVAANADGQTYSLWFRSDDGDARLLGDVKDPVTEAGELTAAGPSDKDVDAFPQWFATYDAVLVTLDAKGATKPGKVVLSGDLPNAR